MYAPVRIITNFPKEQIAQSIKELERSIEADKAEIGLYQILDQKLSATSVTSVGGSKLPMSVDFALREKDQTRAVLQGLVQREYDEINGKQDVIGFLRWLLPYAK